MKLAGQLMRVYLPEPLRRRALIELFDVTARAFGVAAPNLTTKSAQQILELFAIFTAEQAGAVLRHGCAIPLVRTHLYEGARSMGARLRHDLEISTTGEALAVARALYRVLRIDFRGTAEGEVSVRRCFFSRSYSAAVCRLVSALDQGLMTGLSGGGRLEFQQRITEGAPCCLATFTEAQP